MPTSRKFLTDVLWERIQKEIRRARRNLAYAKAHTLQIERIRLSLKPLPR